LARSSDLRITLLLEFPSSACSRFNWDDISALFHRTPKLDPHFGGQEVFLVVTSKHLKIFAVPLARKTLLTLDEAISLPELHLSSCGKLFHYVDAKYSTLVTRDYYYRLLCSSLHQNTQTHTLAGKNLKVPRRIHFMSPKKLIHFDLRSTPTYTGYTE
jgi:hypothetical protein